MEAYKRIQVLDDEIRQSELYPKDAIRLGLEVILTIAQAINEVVGVLVDIERNQRNR